VSAAGKHQIVFSTDGHCGADLLDYKPYLEQRYHDAFDVWANGFHDAWAEGTDQDRDANHRVGVASMMAPLNWDARMRLEYLDSQGIAAEVLFPNTAPPFYPSGALTAAGPRSPEEYFQRQCFLGASFLHPADCEDRHRIGTRKLMWGADYPHLEGTWPHTLASLRETFAKVPEAELRAMLGGNAAQVFRFDVARLEEVAQKIGPSLDDIRAAARAAGPPIPTKPERRSR